jgi:hypothetical protein
VKTRLRHGIYWVAVAFGLPLILFAAAGSLLNDYLEPLYGKLRTWTHQDRYMRLSVFRPPDLAERWRDQ